MRRFAIDRGEAVAIFDPTFKTFDLEFDFKYLNCRGVKIDNYIQILLQKNGPILNRLAFVAEITTSDAYVSANTPIGNVFNGYNHGIGILVSDQVTG